MTVINLTATRAMKKKQLDEELMDLVSRNASFNEKEREYANKRIKVIGQERRKLGH